MSEEIVIGRFQLSVKYLGRLIKLAPNAITFPVDQIDLEEFVEDLRRPFSHTKVELNLTVVNQCGIDMDFTFFSLYPLDDFSLELMGELLLNSEMIPHFVFV